MTPQKLRFHLPVRAAALLGLALASPLFGLNPGDPAPAFKLKGVDGKDHTLQDYVAQKKAVVVVFTCNTCPVAIDYEARIIALTKEYAPRGVALLAVNSNDPARVPGDSFDAMKARAQEKGYPFPYLHDETQQVARAYGATVTPHVFVIDPAGKVRYIGRVDDNQSQDPSKKTSHDLRNALDALLAGSEPPQTLTKAFGCTIKWRE